MLTVTFKDLIHATLNDIPNMACSGLAYAVDRLAHSVFKIHENTYASYTVKVLSIGMGVTLGYYLSSKQELFPFTLRKVLEIFAIQYLALGALSFLVTGGSFPVNLLPFASGSFTGWRAKGIVVRLFFAADKGVGLFQLILDYLDKLSESEAASSASSTAT